MISNGSDGADGPHLKAPDKSGYPHNIFLLSPQKICCGYSLEVQHQAVLFHGEVRKIFVRIFLLSGAMVIFCYLMPCHFLSNFDLDHPGTLCTR